jgi:MscS family membrane protein
LFAYVMTGAWDEFLGIREDILLRVMDIVEASGTAMAFPSRTVYFGRDAKPDQEKALDAQAQVQAWRQEGTLPFPDFSPAQVAEIRRANESPLVGPALASGARP